jgi:hypothetical protein
MTTHPPEQTTDSGKRRPEMRAWIVQDREGQPSTWTELAGLWRTKKGAGFSGAIRKPAPVPAGRLVILPAHMTPGATANGEG